MSTFTLWGSALSPFALKLRALFDCAGVQYRWRPAGGTTLENLRTLAEIQRAKQTRTVTRFGGLSDDDEFPLVPFLVERPDGRRRARVHYDSSALSHWLDATFQSADFTPADPAQAFIVRLVDEAFDEFGLYMVHHQRWVTAMRTCDAGMRLANEAESVLPRPLRRFAADRFSRRQVARLPYLFSVGPFAGDAAGIDPRLVPPGRAGFPPTHALLDSAWKRALAATEGILATRPYLLGNRFTLADASVHGQLGMNLTDPDANDALQARAPVTHRWLCHIRDGGHLRATHTTTPNTPTPDALQLDRTLAPLIDFICQTFVPLMRQNAAALQRHTAAGQTVFNERAFDRGEALYDGALLGHPFRSVAKTFQARVWADLQTAWQALDSDARQRLLDRYPALDDGFR